MEIRKGMDVGKLRNLAAKPKVEGGSKPKAQEPAKKLELDEILLNYSPQAPSLIPPHPKVEKGKFIITPHTLETDKYIIQESRKEIPLREDGKYLFSPKSPLYDVFNLMSNLNRELKVVQKALGREITWGNPMKDKLTISAHEGLMENAYYAEMKGAIKVFFMTHVDPKTKVKMYRLATDPDVVTHEMGHAIVDSIRDQYNESFYPETTALHEALADIYALLTAASDEKVLEEALKGINLKKDNPMNHIAEGFGKAESHSTLWDLFLKLNPFGSFTKFLKKYSELKRNYLRDLSNNFKYKRFSELEFSPKEKDPVKRIKRWQSEVFGEPHSYSKVFSGGVWKAIEYAYKDSVSKRENLTEEKAKEILKDIISGLTVDITRGLDLAPVTNPSFREMALSIIAADKLFNKGKLSKALEKAFQERGIISDKDLKELDERLRKAKEFKVKLPEEVKNAKISLRTQRLIRDMGSKGELLGKKGDKSSSKLSSILDLLMGNMPHVSKEDMTEYEKLKNSSLKVAKEFLKEGKEKGLLKNLDEEALKNLEFYEMQRDKEGNVNLLFTYPLKTPFLFATEGGGFTKYDMRGGLLLSFDPKGNLRYYYLSSFDLNKLRDTSKLIEIYLKRQRIKPLKDVKNPEELLDLAGVIDDKGNILPTGSLIS